MSHEKQNAILSFWFGDDTLSQLKNQRLWFTKSEKFDGQIKNQFESYLTEASSGAFDDWSKTDRGSLALTILCDQFPRNMYRGTEAAFAYDEIALRAAQIAVDQGFDKNMTIIERCFLYLPFEHSEDLSVQNQSIELFSQLAQEAKGEETGFAKGALEYSVRHFAIIEKYGRFPFRNAALGRSSTREEQNFLRLPDSHF